MAVLIGVSNNLGLNVVEGDIMTFLGSLVRLSVVSLMFLIFASILSNC